MSDTWTEEIRLGSLSTVTVTEPVTGPDLLASRTGRERAADLVALWHTPETL
jgi:hypothetical protein